MPIISHILRESEGGLPEVIECLRGSSDPKAQQFIEKYDSVARSDITNGRVKIEHISVAAGVQPDDLLAVATKAVFNAKKVTSALKLASAHPKLVDKSIQMGLQDKGVKDREMMHSAIGFLPQSSNVTNFFKVRVNHLANPEQGQELEVPVTDDLPDMDGDIVGLHQMATKMLGAGEAEAVPMSKAEWEEPA